jgi:FixJ family two-component response regulator
MQRASPVVAVVEDDQSMRRSLERLLSVHGFLVASFLSAETFLAWDHDDQPACLLLDIQLPGMSGLQLLSHMTASGVSVPTIFITAVEDDGIEAAAKRLGCVAYLHKPFPSDLLVSAIKRAIGQRFPH